MICYTIGVSCLRGQHPVDTIKREQDNITAGRLAIMYTILYANI